MGGSRKGEHRGNARKRAAGAPKKPRAPATRRPTHETPNDVMRQAARARDNGQHLQTRTVEKRIEIARIISGDDGSVQNLTPKEVMLENMWYFQQAARDWQSMLIRLASDPAPTDEVNAAILRAEQEVERHRLMASNEAFRVAQFIHPRLAAVRVLDDPHAKTEESLTHMLLDEVDADWRNHEMKLVQEIKSEAAE